MFLIDYSLTPAFTCNVALIKGRSAQSPISKLESVRLRTKVNCLTAQLSSIFLFSYLLFGFRFLSPAKEDRVTKDLENFYQMIPPCDKALGVASMVCRGVYKKSIEGRKKPDLCLSATSIGNQLESE